MDTHTGTSHRLGQTSEIAILLGIITLKSDMLGLTDHGRTVSDHLLNPVRTRINGYLRDSGSTAVNNTVLSDALQRYPLTTKRDGTTLTV